MPNVSKVREITRQALKTMRVDLTEEQIEECVDYAWTLNDLGLSEHDAAVTACKEYLNIERSF